MKAKTKRKKTTAAKDNFDAWNETREPIGDYKPLPDERIVPCWFHMEFPKYYVSETGVVLSFCNEKPIVLKPSPLRNGYLRVTLCHNGKSQKPRIHQLTWLSFVYASIPQDNKSEPILEHAPVWSYTGQTKYEQAELDRIADDLKTNVLEVHHSDKNKTHNNIRNMIVVPNALHKLLDTLPPCEPDKLLELLNNKDLDPYIPEGKALAFTADSKAFMVSPNDPKIVRGIQYYRFKEAITNLLAEHPSVNYLDYEPKTKKFQCHKAYMKDGNIMYEPIDMTNDVKLYSPDALLAFQLRKK